MKKGGSGKNYGSTKSSKGTERSSAPKPLEVETRRVQPLNPGLPMNTSSSSRSSSSNSGGGSKGSYSYTHTTTGAAYQELPQHVVHVSTSEGSISSDQSPTLDGSRNQRWRGSMDDLEKRYRPNHLRLWLFVLAYVGTGIVYYALNTRWGVVDSVYFTVQTVLTV